MDAPERYLLVATGGALGALARYYAYAQFGAATLTTFAVNISGTFLLGILMGSAAGADLRWRLLAGIGFLSGYTTFATLEFEAMLAWRQSGWLLVAANLLGSVVVGFAAVVAGFAFGERLH